MNSLPLLTPRKTPPQAEAAERGPTGFALFNLGFRPFYLLAALCAAGLLPLWLAQYTMGILPGSYVNGPAWHAHEMVFGFAAAVVTGFLFTAGRNWTGLATPSGTTLAGFSLLWLAGRILMLTGPASVAAGVDTLFLPLVALALGRILYRAGNRRNYFLLAILLVLTLFNALFHLAANGMVGIGPSLPVRWALYLVMVLVAAMGGRVIPFFTANALPRLKQYQRPWLDKVAIAMLIVALVSAAADAPGYVVAPLCLVAAIVHTIRLAGWRPDAVLRKPILWVLHLAYAWIPVGLAMLGLAALGYVAGVFAWHAFAVGALGMVTIGMMTRTSRGHTGSPLLAGRADVASYVLVLCAGLTRVGMPLLVPHFYLGAVVLSGTLWSIAFLIFAISYGPLLCRPRHDGKPG
jgi:uncharacterized protein involved in response to NO